MRISGTEPSSMILSQKNEFSKVEKRCRKRAKTSWSQKVWCNKPTKLQFQQNMKYTKNPKISILCTLVHNLYIYQR